MSLSKNRSFGGMVYGLLFVGLFVLSLDYWTWNRPIELRLLGLPFWVWKFVGLQLLLTLAIAAFAKFYWKNDA